MAEGDKIVAMFNTDKGLISILYKAATTKEKEVKDINRKFNQKRKSKRPSNIWKVVQIH